MSIQNSGQQSAQDRPEPTERFQRMLAFASDEADALGHGYITCQHLLYALSRESKGLASAALDGMGITPDALHDLLVESSAEHDRIEGRIDLAEEVRAVIDRAVSAARLWGHRWLDTEHVLYGIVSAPTSADEMLAALRVSPNEIAKRLGVLQQDAPPAAIREEAAHAYRLTLESAWLLSLAMDIARQHGATMINSLHVLAAIIGMQSPAQVALVEAFDLRVEDIKRRIRIQKSAVQGGVRLPLGEDVQRILGYAIGEAWNRGHLAVTPLHIAMGLARAENCLALDVLAELGAPQADLVDVLSAAMPPSTTR